jgi:hypothetical protein
LTNYDFPWNEGDATTFQLAKHHEKVQPCLFIAKEWCFTDRVKGSPLQGVSGIIATVTGGIWVTLVPLTAMAELGKGIEQISEYLDHPTPIPYALPAFHTPFPFLTPPHLHIYKTS